MSMTAIYQQIPSLTLLKGKDLFDTVEALQENNELQVCDIGKMWDALHFILTGVSASYPIEDDLTSEIVVGVDVLDEDDFTAVSDKDKVVKMSQVLQSIDFNKYMDKFNMNDYLENDIYPNIWSRIEETEIIKEELRSAFESLKAFYFDTAEKGYAVIVSIY